jgi:hypothetical protein
MADGVHIQRHDPRDLLDNEGSLMDEVRDIFAEPRMWMSQEHPLLGGRSPQDCIDGGDPQLVRDLLRNIRFVAQT